MVFVRFGLAVVLGAACEAAPPPDAPAEVPSVAAEPTSRTVKAAGVKLELPLRWAVPDEADPDHARVHVEVGGVHVGVCDLGRPREGVIPSAMQMASETVTRGRAYESRDHRVRVVEIGSALLRCRARESDGAVLAEIESIIASAGPDPDAPEVERKAKASSFVDLCVTHSAQAVYVLGRDGRLWSANTYGDELVELAIEGVAKIGCGDLVVLALTEDGNLFTGADELLPVQGGVRAVDIGSNGALTDESRALQLEYSGTSVHDLPSVPATIESPSALGPARELVGLRAFVGSRFTGCAVDAAGWLWCWTAAEWGPLPVAFKSEGHNFNEHTGQYDYGPEPIVRLTTEPGRIRNLEHRFSMPGRICAKTDEQWLCVDSLDNSVKSVPTCTAELCACDVFHHGLHCDDDPVDIHAELESEQRIVRVIAHDRTCLLTDADEVFCHVRGKKGVYSLSRRTGTL